LLIDDEETGSRLMVPEGTVVAVSHYAIHHNEKYFPQPFKFEPERWIVGERNSGQPDESVEESLARAKSAFCPFSIGPWACIARNMAYSELSVAVARVLWLYDPKLAKGQEGIGDSNAWKTWGGLGEEEGGVSVKGLGHSGEGGTYRPI
jgi:cytochrome P450